MRERERLLLKIVNCLSLAGVLVVNALSNLLPINGYTAAELSNLYPNLFVPAGITFSIWGVIYLLLIAFCLYQFFGGDKLAERVGWLFPLSCVGNVGWLLAWHYRLVGLSVVVMVALLVTLILIYFRLGIALRADGAAERLFGHIPFGVYTGWICVALIANVTAFLVHVGWSGFGLPDAVWALVMILLAGGLGSAIVILRRDIPLGVVFIWTFIGILIKRSAAAGGGAEAAAEAAGVIEAAIVGIVVVATAIVLDVVRRLHRSRRAM